MTGWRDRWVGACLSLLAGAVALFVAVQLIEAVWTVLVVIAVVVVALLAGIALWRSRMREW